MVCSWLGRATAAFSCVALLVVAGCGPDDDSIGPRAGPDIRQALVPPAAQYLDKNNRFVFLPPDDLTIDQIGEARAVELAKALVARYARMGGLPSIAADRRAKVDQGAARACGRRLFARSPWQPLDPAVARTIGGGVFQRAYGPHWLIPFCEGGGALVFVISVAAYNSALTIEDGKIVLPASGGEWFQWRGVPRRQPGELPVGPEEAVLLASQLSGYRVAGVPELLMPDPGDGSPLDARWSVRLESEAEFVTRAGDKRPSGWVFLGWDARQSTRMILVPTQTQPTAKMIRYPTNLGSRRAGEPLAYADVSIRRDPERPVAFNMIAPVPAANR